MTLTVCEYENIDLLLMLPTTPVKNWFKHMEQNICTISNLLKKIWFMEGFFMAAAVTRPSKNHIVFNTDCRDINKGGGQGGQLLPHILAE
jgi:hypothetical protein